MGTMPQLPDTGKEVDRQFAQTLRTSAKMHPFPIPRFHYMSTAALRFLLLLLLSAVSAGAYADKPAPGKLEPLPPPPAMDNAANDADNEPEVTIIKQTEQTVEEFRVGGRLYMIKITPKVGKPYYLVDDRGDGKFARQESLDSGFRPPRWVIHRF
jgi:hypothetical protein